MNVTLQNVSKRFGATRVVENVSLTIEEGELFFLLGPSGCGKTTLLRLLAGFYQPDEGEIFFGERRMNDVPPNRRHAALVFQNYALWPHLSVFENVAYGLDVRGIRGAERETRVREALAVTRMQEYAERSPAQLSGGQQQRVALARALVIRPDVLLLDEPLSNLDAKLRLEMRDEIRRIHQQLRQTMVYVTHDQNEALSLADRIAVMNNGRVEQVGTPRELYREPRNRFVAGFIGEANFVDGTVTGSNGEHLHVRTAVGDLTVAARRRAFQPGQAVTCAVRPESVRADELRNPLSVTVREVVYLGSVEQYVLEMADGSRWKAIESNPYRVRKIGETVTMGIHHKDVILLED